MKRKSKTEESAFREIAEVSGLPIADISTIVNSFFGAILSESRSLPFDNPRKIFSKDAFDKYVKVQNIPFLGRFGPNYNRYLKWRTNEANEIDMFVRKKNKKLTQEEIEALAEIVLNGGEYVKEKKKQNYKRVWFVGKDGKRLARQAIQKEEDV